MAQQKLLYAVTFENGAFKQLITFIESNRIVESRSDFDKMTANARLQLDKTKYPDNEWKGRIVQVVRNKQEFIKSMSDCIIVDDKVA